MGPAGGPGSCRGFWHREPSGDRGAAGGLTPGVPRPERSRGFREATGGPGIGKAERSRETAGDSGTGSLRQIPGAGSSAPGSCPGSRTGSPGTGKLTMVPGPGRRRGSRGTAGTPGTGAMPGIPGAGDGPRDLLAAGDPAELLGLPGPRRCRGSQEAGDEPPGAVGMRMGSMRGCCRSALARGRAPPGSMPLLGVPSPRTAGGLHKFLPTRKVVFVGLTNFGLSGPGLSEILGTQRTFAFKPPQNTGVLKALFSTAARFPLNFFILCNPRCRLVSSEFVPSLLPWRFPALFWLGDTSGCPSAQGVSRTTNYNLALYRNPAFNYN